MNEKNARGTCVKEVVCGNEEEVLLSRRQLHRFALKNGYFLGTTMFWKACGVSTHRMTVLEKAFLLRQRKTLVYGH